MRTVVVVVVAAVVHVLGGGRYAERHEGGKRWSATTVTPHPANASIKNLRFPDTWTTWPHGIMVKRTGSHLAALVVEVRGGQLGTEITPHPLLHFNNNETFAVPPRTRGAASRIRCWS